MPEKVTRIDSISNKKLHQHSDHMCKTPEERQMTEDARMRFVDEVRKMKGVAREIFATRNHPKYKERNLPVVNAAIALIVKHASEERPYYSKEECRRIMLGVEPVGATPREPAVLAALAVYFNEFAGIERKNPQV